MIPYQLNMYLLSILLIVIQLCFAQTLPKNLFPNENLYNVASVLDGKLNLNSGSSETNEMTLQDAIDLAVGNNFELIQSQKELESTKALYTGSIQDFYVPNLTTALSVEGRRLFTTSTNPTNIAATSLGFTVDIGIPSIVLSKTIFTGFVNLNSYRIAKENYLNAQNTYTNKIREVIYETTVRYYDQFLKQEEVKVSIERLKQLEDQLEQAQINYRNGRVSDFDVSVAKSNFYSAQPTYFIAEKNRIYSRQDFYRYIRYDDQNNVYTELKGNLLDVTNVQFSDFDEEMSLQFVLSNDTTLATLRTAYHNSESQKGIKNAVRLPKIDLQFAYTPSWGRDVAIGNFGESAYNGSYSVTAALAIPILEWIPGTGASSAVRAATQKVIEAKYKLMDAEQLKIIEVKNVLLNIRELDQSVESLRINKDQAVQAAQIARVQYRNGRISLIAYNQAQVDYIDAKRNLLQSVYQALQSKLMLQQLIQNLDGFIAEIQKIQKNTE